VWSKIHSPLPKGGEGRVRGKGECGAKYTALSPLGERVSRLAGTGEGVRVELLIVNNNVGQVARLTCLATRGRFPRTAPGKGEAFSFWNTEPRSAVHVSLWVCFRLLTFDCGPVPYCAKVQMSLVSTCFVVWRAALVS